MKKKESYYFVGIGGVGMSALAHILLEQAHHVSGSDLSLSDSVRQLEEKGARILSSHRGEHLTTPTMVVYSSAIQGNNPEIEEAKRRALPLLHRSELLQQLTASSATLAVAGTHGKTTTSSLLASVLLHANREISFAIGGYLKEYGVNGRFGRDPLFVIEADESDQSFLRYHPKGAIITNVEEEHMESYGTIDALHEAFAQFFRQVEKKEWLFYCGDDPILPRLAQGRGYSYGFSPQCDCRVLCFRQEGWQLYFDLMIQGTHYREICVPLAGKENALNAAAVFALALQLGLSEEEIRKGMAAFQGVGRRMERKEAGKQLLWIDDYAHHPTEVKSTLAAIRKVIGPRRMVVIFQPHRYSRLHALFDDFVTAFEEADQLFITDIYAASETSIPGVNAEKLIEKIGKGARYFSIEEGIAVLQTELVSQDVVVTLGAGNLTYFSGKAAGYCKEHGVRKVAVGLVFGGQSVEHEISRKSAAYVASMLDQELYTLSYFGIDKQGHWQMGERAQKMLSTEHAFSFADDDLFCTDRMGKAIRELDLFFPVIHGPFGEDGTLQGFFEMAQKPYVGPNHRSAAVGMDKVMTKRLLQVAHVPTPAFVAFDINEWRYQKELCLERIRKELHYPLFVKPSHLGSSIGISRIEREEDLLCAIEKSFAVDHEILVEQAILGGREVEFAVIGNGAECEVPPPGEKLAQGQFVDYQMKYSSKPVSTNVVAELDPHLVQRGRELALKAYRVLGSSGMTRVDFLLDNEGTFWCFEVNPIPGMMKYSLFPKMWDAAGLPPQALFNRLIALSTARGRKQRR